MAAATCAALRGARVVLIDENAVPGGQVHRAAVPGIGVASGRIKGGRPAARGARRQRRGGAQRPAGLGTWRRAPGGAGRGARTVPPRRLQRCCDGDDRGPIADRLRRRTRAHHPVCRLDVAWRHGPRRRNDPVEVASGLARRSHRCRRQRGRCSLLSPPASWQRAGSVVGVVDLASRADWLRRAADARRATTAACARRRVARAHRLGGRALALRASRRSCAGAEAVEAVEVAPLTGGVTRRLDCDALCVGHGLVPAIEATLLYRAEHVFRRARGGWVPVLDGLQAAPCRCSTPRATAPAWRVPRRRRLPGEIAALAAMADLRLLAAADAEHAIAARRSAAPARRASARQWRDDGATRRPRGPDTADCVVCRCEDVVRAEIEAAADARRARPEPA